MKSKIQKRIITIGTIILVAIIATITIITFNQIKEVGNATKSLGQTQDIILRSHQLTASSVHYEMNAENVSEKEDKILETEIMLGKKKIDDIISFLASLNVDNPKERIIIDSFVNAAKTSILFSDKLIAAKKSGQLISSGQQALINECKSKVDSVINLASRLQFVENNQQQTQQSATNNEIQNLKNSFYYRFGAIAILAIIVFRKLKNDLSNQQALNQQLKYMSGLINQTEDAIVSSRDDIIETWNKGAEKIYGYTKEEAVGKNAYDIVKTSLDEAGRAAFLEIIQKEGKWHGEAVHTNKNGNKINLLVSITKIEDKTSSNFLVSIAKDITEKKKDEEKIVLFGAMLENSNDAIIIIDSKLNINTWNSGAEKVYGYTAQEAIGKYEPDFLPVDPQTALDIAEEIKNYPTGGHWLGECLHKKKNGDQIDVSISITVFKNTASESVEYVCIITDVTERKKAEEKIKHLASIIQLSNDAIYTTDKGFNITSWNKGAERLYGYTEKEMIGKKEYQILPAFHPVFSENNIQLYEETGYFKTESSHRKKDGQIVIVSISVTYLKDENNNTIGFIIVINDVTEVKKLEAQLKNFNEKLEAEVIEKTKELNDVFGRVTDGFMALNNQKCFTYVNKKAGDILQKDHKDLIGKNIEKEFETIDENFFKAYNKVIKKQQHIHFEDFFESFNSWLEFDFYPSANGVSIYFKDISDQKKTQEDLIKLNYRFRTLASHLQNSREEERINIAREIHDELGQMATAIKIDISWIKKKMTGENEEVKLKMDETIAQLSEMVNTIRRIAQELRPSILDNLGLTAAIEWYCGDFQKRTNIQCKFENTVGDLSLPNNVKTNLFRICQESLTNIMRHANATEVECKILKHNNKIVLMIKDNGTGFDTMQKTKSLGLLGMQERAFLINGELKIESSKESGTTIKVEVES